jgi:osmotically-inducible protein OsmY
MRTKTDDELKHDVEAALKWDTRTWNQSIGVDVTRGIVTLNGEVPTYVQKVAAGNVSHTVAGVLDVANELFVKPKRPYTDIQIARAVRQGLRLAELIPDDRIQSTVIDGWVRLEGKVSSLTERSDAERSVENLAGVAGVINELEVEPPEIRSTDLRRTIQAALERRADREADGLRIDVVNGEVNLFGRVHSWPERKAIVGSIKNSRGVMKINDNLEIDPYF